jgi:hypothetical protein
VKAKGTNIANGVAEVKVRYNMAGRTATRVEEWVDGMAPTVVGSLSQWTHVVYILPQDVNFQGAAGYAYVGSWKSVMFNLYASDVLVQVHEMGHNLGMYHSGSNFDRKEYGDGTCMMGAHVYEDEAPRMCFNAAKSWWLGWYADYSLKLDGSNASWEGKLAGVHDFYKGRLTEGEHYVVIKIRRPDTIHTDGDLYVMFNRSNGINRQVTSDRNHVTVVQARSSTSQSWLVASLNPSGTKRYREYNFDGSGHNLTIQVCKRDYNSDIPDFARVIIYLSGDDDLKLSC